MSGPSSSKPKKQRKNVDSLAPSSSAQGSSKKAQMYNTVNVGLTVGANIAEASDILAPLKAACLTTKTILEVAQANSNQEGWTDLMRRLKEYMSALKEQITLLETYPQEDRAVDEAFLQPLIHYVEFLETVHDMVIDLKDKRSRKKLDLFKAFTKVKVDAGEILKMNRDIEDRHRQLMEALGIFTALRVQVVDKTTKATEVKLDVTKAYVEATKATVEAAEVNIEATRVTVDETKATVDETKATVDATKTDVETLLTDVDAHAILQLPTVAFVASSVHNPCLQGTREAVLNTIWQWADDDTSDKPIFWLCDIAGSGKSTVAMTAVESWRSKGVLGGRFFFSIASNEASTTDKFCSTIARDLVHHIRELAPHVAGAVKQNPSFMRCSLDEQFGMLVTGPLRNRQGRVIFVIDALDECKSATQRKELVEALSTVVQKSRNLRIFITSRPDPVIQAVLGPLSIKAKLEDRLHDVNHRDNIDDIASYVHHSLDGVLSEDRRAKMVKKANGLFIWASTACRMLNSVTSLSPPEDIYDSLMSMEEGGVIDDVYALVFERTDPKYSAVMCAMLALLLAAFEPLTIDDLDDLLKNSKVRGSAKALIQNLGSVLTTDSTTNLIQFRHPTLVEYLRHCVGSPAADSRYQLRLNIANAHSQAASWCLKYLKSPTEGLRFNICQIESSFHLNRQIPDLETRVSKYISRRLRYASSHWLFHIADAENNSWSPLENELRHIIQVPYVFYWMEILSVTGGIPRAIAGLRAITRHTQLEAKTKGDLEEIRRFIMTFSVAIQDSAPHIYVSALPFAPKKSLLHIQGIKKYSGTLRVTKGLEEAYPGLPSFLRGHEGAVYAVGFSPDGSRIVSGSSDKTLRLWDVDTGQPVGEPLRGHGDWVRAVGFSPDGSRIVSGSSDKTLRLWDVDTGQPVGEPLRDGSRIVSGSSDKTLRLWDVDTGQPVGEPLRGHQGSVLAVGFSPDGSRIPVGEPLRGHQDTVWAVGFSPDGSRIVSGSSDKTLRLWDVDTGQPVGEPLRGHQGIVLAVGFSPDGSRIVSGSDDNTLRLWDVDTGQPVGEPLRDGSRIVSGSSDKTLRLWDVDTGQPVGEPLRGHQGTVWAVGFSPDGSRIVSGSSDKTLRLWDVDTGQPVGEPLRGHQDTVWAVGFSPDGSRIVSGSDDNTLRLWDVDTGQPVGEPLRGHQGIVLAVGFSPDGSRIVSGSDDNTLRLWDVDTGQPVGEPLRGHQGTVLAVGFSPDGSRIVSGSSDKTLRLWDVDTGQPVGEPLRGHQGTVWAVGFSPDGSRIVSGSSDKTLRLWDTVWAVGFSPDGSRIVSGSDDKTLRLWDVDTGQPVGEPLRGHGDRVRAVGFSPDGSGAVSGSYDRTIRLWDAGAGTNVDNFTQDDRSPHSRSQEELEAMAGFNLPVVFCSGSRQTTAMDYNIDVFF
ncbi:SubName: Full=Uncharacterized protein {ECO:0000313/EMBL:CCA76115.1} [Serendipita indica DSM 11827]|nr:SubName: Full=Uncharacterized protein {ECO:0000313/EMBL:CCA76115.1} [Serendipita indica DSM 11827]